MAESRPGHQNQLIQLHASQSFSPPWHIDNDHLHITLYTLFLDDYKYQEIMMPILWTAAVKEIIVVILNHMYATEINLSSPSTDMLSTLIYVLLHFPFAYTFIKACLQTYNIDSFVILKPSPTFLFLIFQVLPQVALLGMLSVFISSFF